MKYLILLIIGCVLLSGCDPSAKQANFPVLPPELEHCKIYDIYNGSQNITVMHCPNAVTSTNYKSGNVTKKVIVVDGIEYESKGK